MLYSVSGIVYFYHEICNKGWTDISKHILAKEE